MFQNSRTRIGAALATLAVAALVATGCAGDGGGSGGGGGDASPIKVGQITTISGGYPFGDTVPGTQSYVNWLNDNGGVNGHPVEFVSGDDKGDAAEAAQLARKMVQQDGVVGMVGNTSLVDCQANRAMYEGNNVAVIGGGAVTDCFQQPNWAPVNSGPFVGVWTVWTYVYEQFQPDKACFVGQNDPTSVPYFEQLAADFRAEYGMNIVLTHTNDASQDPTPAVTNAKSEGCDVVIMTTVAPNFAAFVNTAKSVGLDATFICGGSCYDAGLPETLGANGEPGALGPNSKGVYVAAELAPIDDPNENIQAMLDQFEADGVDANFWSQIGWLSAKVFFEGLAQNPDADVTTAEGVLDQLRGMEFIDTGFAATPLGFGDGETHAPNLGGRVLVVQDGGFSDAPGQDGGWTVIEPLPAPEG
ncbi:ABC transporter substrate-binding protein [Microbacterium sp.]|uniref:ABC transporter substrate-binding protein n=1 Tax=Microbacterium sp. TaxID=51671 RepID=UPI003A8C1E76